MGPLRDIRLGGLPLLLLALVSAGATVLILHGTGGRTPAQQAALAALRERPVTRAAATATGPAGAVASAPSTGASDGSSGSGGSSASASSGSGSGVSSAPAPVSTPATSASTPAAAPTTSAAGTSTSAGSATSTTSATSSTDAKLPKVGHVFELVLSAPSYAAAFGRRSKLTELRSLAAKGTLLTNYRSLGRGELADELALVSGQAPNPETSRGCPTYSDFPTSDAANATTGIVPGRGCVYPDSALTIGDQVTASGKVWHAYVADEGKQSCEHPDSGAAEDTALPFADPGYDTLHNPFIFFHSLLDLGDCASDDVDLTKLPSALHPAKATPEFTYLAASACADGDPTMVPASTGTTTTTGTTGTANARAATATIPGATTITTTTAPTTTTTTTTTATATTTTGTTTPGAAATTPSGCPAKAPAGLTAENSFLREWVGRVLRSPAYRRDGVLVIAVAHSGTAGAHPVRTGALVLSRWATRGRRLAAAADPYTLLRFTEDVFGFTRLAHAKTAPALAARILDAK